MSSFGQLPVTLLGLQRLLASGGIEAADALAIQRKNLIEGDARLHCTTQIHAGSAAGTGPLAGVGLAHKDIFHSPNRLARCGSNQIPSGPAASAVVLERLGQAGAADLAALSMAEFACGATGDNPNLPLPVNPVDPLAAVGGSSSGSAVAVAGGLCYGSLGTDTAGSVRIPAATCGLVGLKPTYDLLPRTGVAALAPSLDTVGILARSAADAAVLLATAADPRNSALIAAAANPDRLEAHLLADHGWRFRTAFAANDLATEVADALARFIDALAGRKIGSTGNAAGPLPMFRELTLCAETLLHAEAAKTHLRRLQENVPLAASTRAVALPGVAIPGQWYRNVLAQRGEALRRFIADTFADADILLLPALPNSVPDWTQVRPGSDDFQVRELLALHRWMAFVNYLGLPSIVFPVGVDARGRPVSVQAIARPYAETALLSFAYRCEREFHGRDGVCRSVTPAGSSGPHFPE